MISGILVSGRSMYLQPLKPAGFLTCQCGAFVLCPAGNHTGGLHEPSSCTSTLLSNGTILYTGGGSVSGSASANAEIYDPVASKSTPTGNMTVPRCSETATFLPNGKVLLAGGQLAGSGPTATAELYDPVAGTFASTGNMNVARIGHTATLLPNGKVLVAGGTGTCGGSSCFLGTAELYDPSSGTFSPTGNMAVTSSGHTET